MFFNMVGENIKLIVVQEVVFDKEQLNVVPSKVNTDKASFILKKERDDKIILS